MILVDRLKGPLYLALAASIWGGMYVASKYVLDTVPPFTLLFARYFLASLILLGWCLWKRVAVIPRRDGWLLFQIGFFGYFLSIASQFIGTKLSSAHMGAVITSLSPVFQSLFAVLLLRARITLKQAVSTGISLAGVFLITGLVEANSQSFNPGNLFFLAAACLWGYYSVLSKKAAERHSILQITTWGILWATIFALPPAFTEFHSWNFRMALYSLPVWGGVLYIAIIATTIAFFCWNKGLALTHPHQAGIFFFLQPVVGSLLGWLMLGEALTAAFFLGGILILSGVYFAMHSD
jgi:drug/metabolite transporter (DMT)-like permease